MMVGYFCIEDKTVFSISKLDPDLAMLSLVMSCPLCKASLSVNTEEIVPSFANRVVLTAAQFFKAANGLGLPDSEDASMERVKGYLVGAQIVEVDISEYSSTKTVITSLEIDGLPRRRFHFGTSRAGPIIYKITG